MKTKDIKPINEQGERHGYWEWYLVKFLIYTNVYILFNIMSIKTYD